MASQTSSVPATAYNPDPNTLIVTLDDGTTTIAFEGKYDVEVSGSADAGEARGTLTFDQNFKHGDSAKFNAEDNGEDVTITFTDTEPTLGGSPATAVFKGKGHIRPGTGTGTWFPGFLTNK